MKTIYLERQCLVHVLLSESKVEEKKHFKQMKKVTLGTNNCYWCTKNTLIKHLPLLPAVALAYLDIHSP